MEQVQLDFIIEYTKSDQSVHRIAVRVRPPMFAATRREWDPKEGKYKRVDKANWAQSMRLLYYWIKAKLEAVPYHSLFASLFEIPHISLGAGLCLAGSYLR